MADIEHTPEGNDPAPQVADPIEVRAAEQGWVPEDQWEGDPSKWRPAKEFLDRGELFQKIDEQKREIKTLKMAMEEFGKHHAKVREIEYKRAMADLKAKKRDAIAEGDADAVVDIDDQIDELKEASRTPDPTPEPVAPHPAVVAWQQKNQWYSTNRVMKAAADEVARELVANGERDPVKVLAEVDKVIRSEFKDKFVNPNREKVGSVEGSTNKGRTSKDDDVESQMTPVEKKIMKGIVSSGAMTKEQYLKEYKAYNTKRG